MVTIDALGNRTTRLSDGADNLTGVLDPNSHLTQYLYDLDNRLTVTLDALGKASTQVLDQAGNVTETIDRNGHASQFLYDLNSRLTVTIDALTNRTTRLLDRAGNVTGLVDANGHTTQYLYDAAGRPTVTIDALGNRTTRLLDSAGNVTGLVDANSHTTQFVYDGLNRAIATVDALGNRGTGLFDGAGNQTGSLDGNNRLTQVTYDDAGRPTVAIDALGNRTTSLLDKAGNVTEVLDARGQPTQYVYDALNRATVTIDPLGNRTTGLYDPAGNLTGVLDARGNLTQYFYDADNRPVATVDPLTFRTTSLLDGEGNVTGVQDARGKLWQSLYDALNRQTVTVDPLSNRATRLYDPVGNLTGQQDARGNLTQYLYDAANRLTVLIDPLSNRTTRLYDPAGNPTGLLDANNHLTQYVYDSADRLIATVDGRGNRTTRLLDGAGNQTGQLDGLGQLTQYVSDAANRLTVTVDATTNRTTRLLDGMGNVTGVQDGRGKLTQYLLDAAGRQTVSIDPLGFRTTSLRDPVGNVTSLTDADTNTTTFAYDADNRKTGETDPLGHTATFAYDQVGNLTSTTDRLGQRRDYTYDDAGRMTAETWTVGGSTVEARSYSYDGNGNLLSAGNAQGTYSMTYDADNRVTVVQEPFGQSLTFSYDGVGNRTLVQDSQGGVTTSVYDAANNLVTRLFGGTGQTPLRNDLSYDAANRLSGETRYSDLAGTAKVATTSFLYDAAGRVTDIWDKNGSGSTLTHLTYSYDAAGRALTDATDGTITTYSYDDSNQLTGAGTHTYSYDGTGNRTNTGYSTTSGNQLVNDGVWTYTYDANGQLTGKSKGLTNDTWVYSYNATGQLTHAEEWTGTPGPPQLKLQAVDYKYDAFGNRLESDWDSNGDGTVDGVTRFAYDGWKPGSGFVGTENWDVWADLDGNSSLTTRYLRGDAIDQVFARVGAGTAYWTLTDRQGSVRDVADNSGVLRDQLAYDGWGNIKSETNAAYRGRYTYAGRELDKETGLLYYRARSYDPQTGRWLSRDPLGFDAGDSNLYRYAKNGFPNSSDPSGLDEIPGLPGRYSFSGGSFSSKGGAGGGTGPTGGYVPGLSGSGSNSMPGAGPSGPYSGGGGPPSGFVMPGSDIRISTTAEIAAAKQRAEEAARKERDGYIKNVLVPYAFYDEIPKGLDKRELEHYKQEGEARAKEALRNTIIQHYTQEYLREQIKQMQQEVAQELRQRADLVKKWEEEDRRRPPPLGSTPHPTENRLAVALSDVGKLLSKAGEFGLDVAEGFGGAAYHLLTHPWEVITGPVKFTVAMVKDPGGVIDGVYKAFKGQPGQTIGAMLFYALLGKRLPAIRAGIGRRLAAVLGRNRVAPARLFNPAEVVGATGPRIPYSAEQVARLRTQIERMSRVNGTGSVRITVVQSQELLDFVRAEGGFISPENLRRLSDGVLERFGLSEIAQRGQGVIIIGNRPNYATSIHEVFHMEHWMNNPLYGSASPIVQERYVFERMIQPSVWNNLSLAERSGEISRIETLLQRSGETGTFRQELEAIIQQARSRLNTQLP